MKYDQIATDKLINFLSNLNNVKTNRKHSRNLDKFSYYLKEFEILLNQGADLNGEYSDKTVGVDRPLNCILGIYNEILRNLIFNFSLENGLKLRCDLDFKTRFNKDIHYFNDDCPIFNVLLVGTFLDVKRFIEFDRNVLSDLRFVKIDFLSTSDEYYHMIEFKGGAEMHENCVYPETWKYVK